MAYQLGDIATKARSRVRDDNFSSSQTIDFINDVINDVFNRYRLPFMQAVQTYTVTIGVADITNGSGLPANHVQTIDLIATTQGQEQVIPYKDSNELDRMYPDLDDTTAHPNGQPLYWYWYANTIKVFPAPSDAYTLTLRYYKRPTALVANDAVPEIPSEFEELIVLGTAARILESKDNYDQGAILRRQYKDLVMNLVERYSQAQVGRVTTMKINRYQQPAKSSLRWR